MTAAAAAAKSAGKSLRGTPWPRLNEHYRKVNSESTVLWDWFQGFFYSCVLYFAYPAAVLSANWSPHLLPYTAAFWFVQMTGSLAVFHRYFAHRGYQAVNRVVQCAMAVLGCLSGQGGPIFW